MAQHFLLSRAAKTLSLAQVFALKVNRIAALALKRGKSVDFTGYWQRHVRP